MVFFLSFYSMYTVACLLERDEAGRVGGTDTRATVLDGLVGDRELSEVVANHLGLLRGEDRQCEARQQRGAKQCERE